MHLITLDDTMLSFSKKDGFNRIEGPLVYRIKEKGLRFRERVGGRPFIIFTSEGADIHS
jgi:hypothetical protein